MIKIDLYTMVGFLALSCTVVSAQQSPAIDPSCPTIQVECGEAPPSRCKAFVSGITPTQRISYKWTVVNATITNGQGTSTVMIEPHANQSNVTAVVEVASLDGACRQTASCSVSWERPAQPRLIDRFSELSTSKERVRLDMLKKALGEEPGATAQIVIAGKNRLRRAARVNAYFSKSSEIEPGRVSVVTNDAGEESTTELYLVPRGATPPQPKIQSLPKETP